ncbi:MAG: MFS transporter [Alphaproteobacteria bacterium]
MSSTDAVSIFRFKGQGPVYLMGLGHGATHWVAAVFLFLQPYFKTELGLTYLQAGSLYAIFQASAFVMNFGSGALVDMTGRRVPFQVLSLVIGAAALFVFGLTGAYLVLALMVALIGGSNNLWHPPAMSFLSELYPRSRGYAMSIHALGASIGDAVAPLAAGALLTVMTWQSAAMASAVPAVLTAAVLLLLLLPRDRRSDGQPPRRMAPREYLSGMAGLFRDKAIMGLSLTAGLRSMAQNGLIVFLPFYLVDGLRMSPALAGLTLTAMHGGGLVASPIAGHVSDRIGRRPVVFAGLTLTTIVIVVATFVTDPRLYVGTVAVLGFVLYAIRPVMHSWMLDLAPPDISASATSVMFGVQAILSMLAPLIGGVVADAYGLLAVFYFLAAVMLVANALVAVLPYFAPAMRA